MYYRSQDIYTGFGNVGFFVSRVNKRECGECNISRFYFYTFR